MAESGLTLGLADFRTSVSEFLFGADGDYTVLTASEAARVDRIVDAGLRQFTNPPPVNGRVHQWSFLEILETMTLNAPYSTGTVTIVAGVVTLASGTWPSWAASGELTIDGADYPVSTRDSGTQITLEDTTLAASAGTEYAIHQDDYALPDDFASFIGPITYASADNTWNHVQLVGEGRIRTYRQQQGLSAVTFNVPCYAAVRAVVNDPAVGTRNELMFWPRVASDATVRFTYRVRPDALTGGTYSTGTVAILLGVVTLTGGTWPDWADGGTLTVGGVDYTVASRDSASQLTLTSLLVTIAGPIGYSLGLETYPYGGSDHSETILASIMAVAEQKEEQQRGTYWDQFQQQLASSIELDVQRNRPQYLGQNLDRSDDRAFALGDRYLPNVVTHRGMVVP